MRAHVPIFHAGCVTRLKTETSPPLQGSIGTQEINVYARVCCCCCCTMKMVKGAPVVLNALICGHNTQYLLPPDSSCVLVDEDGSRQESWHLYNVVCTSSLVSVLSDMKFQDTFLLRASPVSSARPICVHGDAMLWMVSKIFRLTDLGPLSVCCVYVWAQALTMTRMDSSRTLVSPTP